MPPTVTTILNTPPSKGVSVAPTISPSKIRALSVVASEHPGGGDVEKGLRSERRRARRRGGGWGDMSKFRLVRGRVVRSEEHAGIFVWRCQGGAGVALFALNA